MIIDAGRDALAKLIEGEDELDDFTYIAYGSGTTAAEAADEDLESQTGSRALATIKTMSILKPDDTISFSADFIATNLGSLTEIGVFTAATEGIMLLRSLPIAPVSYKMGATITVTAEVTVKNFEAGEGAHW